MKFKYVLLVLLVCFLSTLLLFYGESGLNSDFVLMSQLRFPKVITCLFAGGLLAVSGLLMQNFFQNPLAGPDILGISSGASLFVAIWTIIGTSLSPVIQNLGLNLMSFLGALSVFVILLLFLKKNHSKVSLIIIGLLISSFAVSGISVLINIGQALQLKNFLVWSMGSFRSISPSDLGLFLVLSLLSLIPVGYYLKPMNQFLLSENYAKSVGIDVKKMRMIFIAIVAFQVSVVTLYCGPIGFIGIIAPHLGRLVLKRAQLHDLLPGVFLVGAFLALIAELVLVLLPSLSISVNAVLGLIGAPLIAFYLYQDKGSLRE